MGIYLGQFRRDEFSGRWFLCACVGGILRAEYWMDFLWSYMGGDGDSYFNYQDFLRFGFNYGSWFPIPGTDNIISELGSPIFTPYWAWYFSYNVSIKVIGTHYPFHFENVILIVILVFLGGVLVLTLLQGLIKKRRKVRITETEDYYLIE